MVDTDVVASSASFSTSHSTMPRLAPVFVRRWRRQNLDGRRILQVEDEESDKIRIESSRTISIDTFVPRTEIDDRYLDSPYYIAPTDEVGQEAFPVIRDAIRDKGMVALGRVVLSRREHMMMLEAFDKGLLATVLFIPTRSVIKLPIPRIYRT